MISERKTEQLPLIKRAKYILPDVLSCMFSQQINWLFFNWLLLGIVLNNSLMHRDHCFLSFTQVFKLKIVMHLLQKAWFFWIGWLSKFLLKMLSKWKPLNWNSNWLPTSYNSKNWLGTKPNNSEKQHFNLKLNKFNSQKLY